MIYNIYVGLVIAVYLYLYTFSPAQHPFSLIPPNLENE